MNWTKKDNYLKRKFNFSTYQDAVEFLNKVAKIADEIGHHPDMILKYNQVVIRTTTHDTGNTITDKDYNLISLIDQIGY